MSNEPTVRQIMSTPVEALKHTASLSDARRGLAMSPFHHLPVCDADARVIGIVSATDLLRVSLEAYDVEPAKADAVLDAQFRLSEVMQGKVVTVRDDESIRAAAEKLAPGTFHALPVLDSEGRLLGMVTSTDLIGYLLRLLPPA